MSDDYSDELNSINNSIGQRLKSLRIDAGYKSYEVFAWENNLSRIQYWKMEKGTNCTLKSLFKVLKIHNLTYKEFFDSLEDK
ncbi:MAG: hypothetical protein P8O78_06130 [Flavobacteriaceae bacterium]|nr:hypothetical protein [Flavobacteriaceae bacterium]